jgi:hypothetical protein
MAARGWATEQWFVNPELLLPKTVAWRKDSERDPVRHGPVKPSRATKSSEFGLHGWVAGASPR